MESGCMKLIRWVHVLQTGRREEVLIRWVHVLQTGRREDVQSSPVTEGRCLKQTWFR